MHFSTEAAIRLGKGVVESPGPRTGQWESYLHSTTNKNECGSKVHMCAWSGVCTCVWCVYMCVCVVVVFVCVSCVYVYT